MNSTAEISETAISDSTTFAGIVGAIATILITTLDDCVWLVPYLGSSSSSTSTSLAVRIQHAAIFAGTLIGLTSIVVAVTNIFQLKISTMSFSNNESAFNTGIEAFGAVMCWILAGYYYYKSWQKRRRRRMLKQKEQQHQDEEKNRFISDEVDEPRLQTSDNIETKYGSCNSNDDNTNAVSLLNPSTTTVITESTISSGEGDNANDNNNNNDRQSFQPFTIVTLTISGALDEISYFPSLIIGHIFTGTELIVGTFITVLIMLCIVTQLLQYCQPLLNCLDQIPLYGVITLYAIILTINLILDLISSY